MLRHSSRSTCLVLSAFCLIATAVPVRAQQLTFTTFAGSVGGSGAEDGTGSAARLTYPYGLATDRAGNVYVPDVGTYTIRKITAAGVVTTLAGAEGLFGFADGIGGAARFGIP